MIDVHVTIEAAILHVETPVGQASFDTDVAERIGLPSPTRAVARACAADKLAIAIPCHRGVRNSGALSRYDWGVERKPTILDREQAGRPPLASR